MEAQTALSVQSIIKTYPGVKALSSVSIDFRRGEVHALMGENGAGKSTLIKVISGAIQPDSGTITVEGRHIGTMSTRRSMELGIAIIYQELMMVPELSVAENVFLGSPIRRGPFVDHRAMEARSAELFGSLGIDLDPRKRVKHLSVAYQQMIEIARALSSNANILIMDEPSAALTEDEVKVMLELVQRLKESGVTVIYISHRLEEVFQISDRISILRDGAYITTLNTRDTDKRELIQYMVGRSLSETFPEKTAIPGQVGLEVKHFTGNGVENISFSVRRGEVLGIGGLVGAGRTELAQLIFGAAPLEAGELYLQGERVDIRSPKAAVQHGIALIPEDRKQQGLLLDTTIRENITLPSLPKLSRGFLVQRGKELAISREQEQALNIKTPSLDQQAKNLSGGNQQKVVLAKWLAAACDYLIFDEPTRGIDVGAKQEIYKLINRLASEGKCIIMISSEMEELMGVSDRIVVLCEGRVTGTLEKSEFSQDLILTLASGS